MIYIPLYYSHVSYVAGFAVSCVGLMLHTSTNTQLLVSFIFASYHVYIIVFH
jgi:hypothetical protein